MKKYSAVLFMAGLAILCLILHFWFGWQAHISEAISHNQSPDLATWRIEWARDTFENLQSEFWQLAVQFLLLAGALELFRIKAYEKDAEETKTEIKEVKNLITPKPTLEPYDHTGEKS